MDPDRRVRRIVARAHRACVLARAAETFLVGAFGMLLALTAIAWQESPMATVAAWGAALLAGCAAGAAWWLEVRPDRRIVARRIDRELGHDGAFFTAWEQCVASPPRGLSSIALLLVREVGGRVPVRRATRCVLPNSMPLLALPFLGAALLALVRGVEPPPSVSPAWQPRVAGFAGAMEDVESAAHGGLAAGEIDAAELRELVELNQRSRELERRTRAGEWGPDEARASLEELAGELERQARELSPLSELARTLERAAARADALLVPERSGGGSERGGELEPAEAPVAGGPGEGAGPAAGGDSTARDDPELTNAGRDGTMMDRSEPGEGAPEAPGQGVDGAPVRSPDDPGPAGVASGRWWSERDAAVVERWERRLRARGSPARDED